VNDCLHAWAQSRCLRCEARRCGQHSCKAARLPTSSRCEEHTPTRAKPRPTRTLVHPPERREENALPAATRPHLIIRTYMF
jgi:hypothetical protein